MEDELITVLIETKNKAHSNNMWHSRGRGE